MFIFYDIFRDQLDLPPVATAFNDKRTTSLAKFLHLCRVQHIAISNSTDRQLIFVILYVIPIIPSFPWLKGTSLQSSLFCYFFREINIFLNNKIYLGKAEKCHVTCLNALRTNLSILWMQIFTRTGGIFNYKVCTDEYFFVRPNVLILTLASSCFKCIVKNEWQLREKQEHSLRMPSKWTFKILFHF